MILDSHYAQMIRACAIMLTAAKAVPVPDPEVQNAIMSALTAVRDTYRIAYDLAEKVH